MILPAIRRSLLVAPRAVVYRTAGAASIRAFSRSAYQFKDVAVPKTAQTLAEVEGEETLIGAGAKEGEVPTDLEQATGLERLELLGLLEGIDVFDRRPLDSSRRGTIANPIVVDSYEEYRYVGCTGSPAGSHSVEWLKPTVDKPGRCWECGSVYTINNLSIPDPEGEHGHGH